MGKIDFRVRPPYKSYTVFFEGQDGLKSFREGFLGVTEGGSIETKSVDDLQEELKRADIDVTVLPGRGAFGVPTDELFEYADQYPGKVIVFPYIDPIEGQKALDDIDKFVIHGKGQGVALEPGVSATETYGIDDGRAQEVYKKLEDHDIPLLLTYSHYALPVLDTDLPRQLDNVAKKYPKLKIIVAHAGYPFIHETISTAITRDNVYLIPDVYGLKGPGADQYITAAKTVLKDKIVYGSSYPIVPIEATAEFVENEWGLDEETKQKIFHDNAAGILKL